MELVWWIASVLGFIFVAVLLLAVAIARKAISNERAPDYDIEDTYKDEHGVTHRFEGIDAEPTRLLSVVVPAYKEAKRIPAMLAEMLPVLEQATAKDPKFTWEVLIVNDGSPDTTGAVVYKYVQEHGADKIRLLNLFKNNGKGGAVRKGMVRARGQFLLMADADGATKASDVHRLLEQLRKVQRDGQGIAVGSRAHMEDEAGDGNAKAKRTPLRKLLMWGFHTLITLMIGNTHIRDTQCGFKLFTRRTARLLFPVQHIDRWAFDVELLYLAAQHNTPMVEVPVTWNEIDGSTLNVLESTIQMARDIIAIRICYLLRIWVTTPTPTPVLTSGQLEAASAPVKSAPAASASRPDVDDDSERLPTSGAAAVASPSPSPASNGGARRRPRQHAE